MTTIVEVRQDDGTTGGNLMIESKGGQCAPNTDTVFTYYYPIKICAMTIRFNTTMANTGDHINLIVNPDTVIGALTSAVTAGDTVLNVSSTVTTYAKVGHFVTITDGTNTDEKLWVTAVDDVGGTITVWPYTDGGPTPGTIANNYSAGAGILLNVYAVNSFVFGAPGVQVFGEDKVSGTMIPAGSTIKLIYTNNENKIKDFTLQFEYMF
jgi:hypothetical protein